MLAKEIVIPDRREKLNWDVFEELMFSSWLNLFEVEDKLFNTIKWKSVIEKSLLMISLITRNIKQYRLMFIIKV